MYLVVFIHEFGHIFMALIFKFKINRVNIYPFGGYTIFENDINIPFITEFMVFIGGVLFQIIFFIIIRYFIDNGSYIYELIKNYNLSILLFNMLPIIPLDGSKILNIFFNKILPFKISHLITIYISYIAIIILFILNIKNLNMVLMMMLLLIFVIKEHRNHKFIFNTFLIERYIKDIRFRKNNFVDNIKVNNMKKYAKNIFVYKNKYIDEKDILFNSLYNKI